MTKEELLKEIMKLPKAETDNPISTMNSINVDDLINAVDRLNKIPDYNDLLKENQELKKQLEDKILLEMKLENELFNKRKEYQETYKDVRIEIKEYKTQQQEFINYLEDMLDDENDIFSVVRVKDVLQKYKETIGDDK